MDYICRKPRDGLREFPKNVHAMRDGKRSVAMATRGEFQPAGFPRGKSRGSGNIEGINAASASPRKVSRDRSNSMPVQLTSHGSAPEARNSSRYLTHDGLAGFRGTR